MHGAPPFLVFKKPTEFWVNGIKYAANQQSLIWNLSQLPEGTYTLKIPQSKACEFTIAKPGKSANYAPCGWNVQNTSKALCWNPSIEPNITGLDYSQLMPDTENGNPLTHWINAHARPMIVTTHIQKNISQIQLHNS